MTDGRLTTTSYDQKTGIFTTEIQPLSINDLKKQLAAEGVGIKVKVNIHPDIPNDVFADIVHQRPDSGMYACSVKPLFLNETYRQQLALMGDTWRFAKPAQLIQIDLLYQRMNPNYESFLQNCWSRAAAGSVWEFEGGVGKLFMHPRVTFMPESKEHGPHYYVDHSFLDNMKGHGTGVIGIKRKK